ncbi:MAG: 2-oxoglutarate dehydrogenase complex dihydrolipoyllysine-residue succinyltransferase [Saprospiraceae bacterium]|nr:2-oxoglutarate dehydrogenase complex dihydrolipoyllysine-residue succinyltransferase [Saprospiraceae bacterium]
MAIIELKVPPIGESITEVTLSRWLKPDGSVVQLDEPICEFDSDKATLEFPSEASGKLVHVAREGEDLPIGALVAHIDTSMMTPIENHSTTIRTQVSEQESKVDKIAAPSAAKILREAEISVSKIPGTGKGGRITKQDALMASSHKSISEDDTFLESGKEIKLDAVLTSADLRNTRREKMSRMRRTISKRLVNARNQTAMLTTFNEVDMSALIELRKKYNEDFEKKHGIKIGFMSLFAKACSQVLIEMPEVNAFIEGEEIIYHDYVDIAIAISTPQGLVVPPVKNVEHMSIYEFEKQLKILADKARTASLTMDEMSGGTFTITNGGIFGSLMSTPILNEPQSAILGMHAIKERPVVVNGTIVARPMMYLALSYDHRLIDGSSSVRFLVKVKELLEDPVRMFLQL